MTQAVQTAQLGNTNPAWRNRIINGGMVIDQRYAGTATANTISGYTLDRWSVYQSTTGKVIAQQNAGSVTPPAGFVNYLGITSQSAYTPSSTDVYNIAQWIEGYNVADLGFGAANAKTVTLSFWVRSSLTGTFAGSIIGSNGSGSYRSYIYTYTISAANTWEYKTITIPGDTTSFAYNTTNGQGLYVSFTTGAGSTIKTTAGAWTSGLYYSTSGAVDVVGTNGATFYITGVQLEVGTAATNFEFRDYGRELIMCQRYYFKIAGDTSTYGYANLGSGYAYSNGTTALTNFPVPVTMRANPTAGFGGTITVSTPVAGAAVTGITTVYIGNGSIWLVFSTVSIGSGANYSAFAYTGNAPTNYVYLSAEL